jgi:glycosyltransferase involved in cell wall biosynthesis
MSASFRPCAVVPTYENPLTVRAVVTEILRHDLPVVLVDDGSGPAGRAACEELRALAQVTVHRHAENRGKGAAVTSGMRIARERGHTHAFQIDADLQHDLARIPDFLAAARAQPEALVLGYPLYDASAPLARRWARRFTHLWVALEVGSRAAIRDASGEHEIAIRTTVHLVDKTGARVGEIGPIESRSTYRVGKNANETEAARRDAIARVVRTLAVYLTGEIDSRGRAATA